MKVQYQSTRDFEGTDSYIKIKFWFICCTERSKNSDSPMLRVLNKTSFSLNWDIRATTTGKYQIRLEHNHCSNPRRQYDSLQKRKERKNIFETSCPQNNGVITFHSSYVHWDIKGIAIHELVYCHLQQVVPLRQKVEENAIPLCKSIYLTLGSRSPPISKVPLVKPDSLRKKNAKEKSRRLTNQRLTRRNVRLIQTSEKGILKCRF